MTALIEKIQGRDDDNSAYGRIFGDIELGKLISRVHGTAIKNGILLEKMIFNRSRLTIPCSRYPTLDCFLNQYKQDNIIDGMYVVDKQSFKDYCNIKSDFDIDNKKKKHEPDFFIIDIRHVTAYIVEIKDGDTFDTKKSYGEYEAFRKMASISSRMEFKINAILCGFNVLNKERLVKGLKNEVPIEHIMTGREFCNLIGLDYDDIVKIRKNGQPKNIEYFDKEYMKMRERLLKNISPPIRMKFEML